MIDLDADADLLDEIAGFWNRFGPASLSAPANADLTRLTQERTE